MGKPCKSPQTWTFAAGSAQWSGRAHPVRPHAPWRCLCLAPPASSTWAGRWAYTPAPPWTAQLRPSATRGWRRTPRRTGCHGGSSRASAMPPSRPTCSGFRLRTPSAGGMMKWSAIDTSNNGLACFMKGTMTGSARTPADVDATNADDITCRMAAPTSRIYVPGGSDTRGFSEAYRSACERVATASTTPKYAAIDILLWLSLTDPNVMAIKPGTMMFKILNQDSSQVSNCWKCLTIMGMSEAMHGYRAEGLTHLENAVYVVRKQTGSVPQWLISRVQAAAADLPSSAQPK